MASVKRTKATKTRARFLRLVKSLGGVTKAAKRFRCSPSAVSRIGSGDLKPGLDLAGRIGKLSGAGACSKILATDWI